MLIRVGPKQNAHNVFSDLCSDVNVNVSYEADRHQSLNSAVRPFPLSVAHFERERQKISLKTQMFKLKNVTCKC